MDTAVRITPAHLRHCPAALLWALPTMLVLADVALRADPLARLWTMPTGIAAALGSAIVAAVATGAIPALARLWHEADMPFRLLSRAAMALGALAIALTAARAIHPGYGMIKLGELALIATLSAAFAGALLSPGGPRARALMLAVFGGVAIAVPVIALFRTIGWPDGATRLALPGFVHIRIFGMALALAICAGAAHWDLRTPLNRAARALALLMLWTALCWSGSRGGLAALAASLPLLWILVPASRHTAPLVLATALTGAALSLAIPASLPELGLAGRFAGTAGAASADALASGRLVMWQAILQATAADPLVGIGYAQAHWVFSEAGFAVAHLHTHNIALDAALALGWPGAALLALIMAAAWILGARTARRTASPEAASAWLLLTVFLVYALVDGLYFYHHALVPLAVAVSVLLAARSTPARGV